MAEFVRNAWGDAYGPVSTGDVRTLLEETEDEGTAASIWDGVFSEEQAERGRAVSTGACGFRRAAG